MSNGKRYDAVIIGDGHNGLVCACYLAAAGLEVRVLERREIVGGGVTGIPGSNAAREIVRDFRRGKCR